MKWIIVIIYSYGAKALLPQQILENYEKDHELRDVADMQPQLGAQGHRGTHSRPDRATPGAGSHGPATVSSSNTAASGLSKVLWKRTIKSPLTSSWSGIAGKSAYLYSLS